jgi:hypothetical protein
MPIRGEWIVRLSPFKRISHRRGIPLSTTRRWDATRVQSIGNLPQRCCTGAAYLTNEGQHVIRVLIRQRFD